MCKHKQDNVLRNYRWRHLQHITSMYIQHCVFIFQKKVQVCMHAELFRLHMEQINICMCVFIWQFYHISHHLAAKLDDFLSHGMTSCHMTGSCLSVCILVGDRLSMSQVYIRPHFSSLWSTFSSKELLISNERVEPPLSIFTCWHLQLLHVKLRQGFEYHTSKNWLLVKYQSNNRVGVS